MFNSGWYWDNTGILVDIPSGNQIWLDGTSSIIGSFRLGHLFPWSILQHAIFAWPLGNQRPMMTQGSHKSQDMPRDYLLNLFKALNTDCVLISARNWCQRTRISWEIYSVCTASASDSLSQRGEALNGKPCSSPAVCFVSSSNELPADIPGTPMVETDTSESHFLISLCNPREPYFKVQID